MGGGGGGPGIGGGGGTFILGMGAGGGGGGLPPDPGGGGGGGTLGLVICDTGGISLSVGFGLPFWLPRITFTAPAPTGCSLKRSPET